MACKPSPAHCLFLSVFTGTQPARHHCPGLLLHLHSVLVQGCTAPKAQIFTIFPFTEKVCQTQIHSVTSKPILEKRLHLRSLVFMPATLSLASYHSDLLQPFFKINTRRRGTSLNQTVPVWKKEASQQGK